MSNGMYIGVSSTAHKVKGMYIGVDGVARKVTKAYIGVDGVARLFWQGLSNVLNDCDWSTIRAKTDDGTAANIWSVGDAKEVIINGKIGDTTFTNVSMWAFILGFDHNSSIEGTKRTHFQLGRNAQTDGSNICLIGSVYGNYSSTRGVFSMNPAADAASSTNTGGWNSSKMRTTVLGASRTPTSPMSNSYVAALPYELRAVMKSAKKYTDNTAGGTDDSSKVIATTDYMSLPSEFEVFGRRSEANSAEQNFQKQYDYYKAGNTAKFFKYNDQTASSFYWLRSPKASSATHFCLVVTGGNLSSLSAGYCCGVAPIFYV